MSDFLNFKIERDELSERLGGGLPKGSLIVVEGPFGAGKSLFTQRVLYGLAENDHKVAMVSTELTTLGFVRQMKSLEYPVDRHLLGRNLLFFPVYPLVGDRQVPRNLLRRLRTAENLFEREVLFIDAFSKLLADQLRVFHEQGTPPIRKLLKTARHAHIQTNVDRLTPEAAIMAEAEETLYKLKKLTAQGKTIILTIEPEQVTDNLRNLFRDASDVHLTLDFQLIGGSASRRIIVNRFSRAKGRFGDVIGYRVEPGVGLVIEIKSVA